MAGAAADGPAHVALGGPPLVPPTGGGDILIAITQS